MSVPRGLYNEDGEFVFDFESDEPGKILQDAWEHARNVLSKEGYVGASKTIASLRQRRKQVASPLRRIQRKRLYYQLAKSRILEDGNRYGLDCEIGTAFVNNKNALSNRGWRGWDTPSLPINTAYPRLSVGLCAFLTRALDRDYEDEGSASGNAEVFHEPLTLRIPDSDFEEYKVTRQRSASIHDSDSNSAPFKRNLAFPHITSFALAARKVSAELKRIDDRHKQLILTHRLINFRIAVLQNVVWQYEIYGRVEPLDLGEAEKQATDRDSGESDDGVTEEDLLYTFLYTVEEIVDNQPNATNFLKQIAPAVKKRLHNKGDYISESGLRSRLVDYVLPLLRRKFPDLDLPKGISISAWRRREEDLDSALEQWEVE